MLLPEVSGHILDQPDLDGFCGLSYIAPDAVVDGPDGNPPALLENYMLTIKEWPQYIEKHLLNESCNKWSQDEPCVPGGITVVDDFPGTTLRRRHLRRYFDPATRVQPPIKSMEDLTLMKFVEALPKAKIWVSGEVDECASKLRQKVETLKPFAMIRHLPILQDWQNEAREKITLQLAELSKLKNRVEEAVNLQQEHANLQEERAKLLDENQLVSSH